MDNVGIMYDPSKITTQRKTKVKGFVYSIMLSMFSNSSQKIFRKTMLEHYGEFITVRGKKQDPSAAIKYDYTPYEFGNNKQGYLVSISNSDDESYNINNVLNDSHLKDEGKVWVSKCKDADISYRQVAKIVKDFYFGNSGVASSSLLIDNNDDTTQQNDELIKTTSTRNSVHKMPNREVQDILAQRTSTLCGE